MKNKKISREDFMRLPAEEVRRLVGNRPNPLTGIFLADGNRRLVMMETGLMPGEKDFCRRYVEIVTRYFRQCLKVFFDHGLHTLVFPLFGPSLLRRDAGYRGYVIPELVRTLAQEETWLAFYDAYGIKIGTYGYPSKLDRHFPGLGLSQAIGECVDKTAQNDAHRLFLGFFSHAPYDAEFTRKVNTFIKGMEREPNRGELASLYYGETIETADFFINSTKTAGLEALPPFVCGSQTQVYTLVAPAVFALTGKIFREILYDLFTVPVSSIHGDGMQPEPGSTPGSPGNLSADAINSMKEYYYRNRDKILGLGREIGGYRLLEEIRLQASELKKLQLSDPVQILRKDRER